MRDERRQWDQITGEGDLMKKRFTFGVALCFSFAMLWGQSTAQIHGTIRDASGAAIPGAEVKATQTDTGAVRSVTSDGEGGFVLPALSTGPYKIEVSKDGFSRAVESGVVGSAKSANSVSVPTKDPFYPHR